MGIILYVADKYGRKEIDIKETGVKRSCGLLFKIVYRSLPD